MYVSHDSIVSIATVYRLDGGGSESFHTHPDQPLGTSGLLYNAYRVFFLGVKWPGHVIAHPPPSSTKIKESIELYLCSPFGRSLPVLGQTLPLLRVYQVYALISVLVLGLRSWA